MLENEPKRSKPNEFESNKRRKCDMCDYEIPKGYRNYGKDSQRLMEKHFKSCLPRQTYKCSDCGEIFPKKQELINHMLSVHKKIKTYFDYKCPDCEMSFNKNYLRVKHIESDNHAKSLKMLKKVLECPYCTSSFIFEEKLRSHMKKGHGISEIGFKRIMKELSKQLPEISSSDDIETINI